jgi:hypothetical protein
MINCPNELLIKAVIFLFVMVKAKCEDSCLIRMFGRVLPDDLTTRDDRYIDLTYKENYLQFMIRLSNDKLNHPAQCSAFSSLIPLVQIIGF